MRARLIAPVAAAVAVLLCVGTPADPVSASEHARRDLAARTLADARAAAAEAMRNIRVPVSVAEEPVPVETGQIDPGTPATVDAEKIDTTVEFSGHKVGEPLDVTVSELPGSAAVAAAAESAGVVVSAPFDVTATTASGTDVTQFPADPTIVKDAAHHDVVTAVDPGVALDVDVTDQAIDGLDPSSLRIVTRENPGDPWVEIPSYYDPDSGSVKGEIDHLSQFVVIGTPFVPPPGPRIVLDPDDNVGHTTGPGGAMTELPQNLKLASRLAAKLEEGCLADVLVTRTADSPDFVSAATRAGMAAAHHPDLTITLAFNANVGHAWGSASDGGSIVYSRGRSADNAVQASLAAELPQYTGRPARGASSAFYPYGAFDGVSGAMTHLETLFIDHNYDRPVIDKGFSHIVDGVFTGLGKFLQAKGFDCTDPKTGGWPARPSKAELAKWRHLGYQNYLTYGGDPVSFSTGNLVESERIFSLSGVGNQSTDLTLVYNSQDGRAGRVGAGWNFGLGGHAQRFDDGSVLVVRGDGASFMFEPDGSGGFTAEPGTFLTLVNTADGKLRMTSVRGESWVFAADDIEGIGELEAHTDRQGNTVSLTYATPDDNDQFVPLASITDEAGQVIQVGHDAAGRISSFTHPDGRVWTLGYDAAGDLTTIAAPGDRIRTFTYDDAHQLLTATDAAGITYLKNSYDDSGRVVKQWDADGNLRTFAYEVGADGGETTYTDNEGNPTVFRFDARSRITEITDATGATESFRYDDDDQVIAHTDKRGKTTRYAYDESGNVVTETAPDGTVKRYTYTPTGELATVTDRGGADGAARTTTSLVDDRGLTTRVIRPDGLGESNAYDEHGDLIATTDAAGGVTRFAYDARGNIVARTDPAGNVTRFAYDAANRLVKVTDAAGNTTSYTWDAGDRLVTQVDAAGGVTRFTYDANDHPLTATTPDGATTRYRWDALFRVVSVTDPLGATTTFRYNTEDAMTAITDPLGATTTFALDDVYRPVKVTDPAGQVWASSYDAAGNVVSSTDPRGATSTFAYDDLGRLVASTDAAGATSSTVFDAVGRVVAQIDPLRRKTVVAYDILDRPVAVTDPAGATTQYGYDALGNTTQLVDARGMSTRYRYDAISQLTSWAGPAGTGGSYRYDALGNVTAASDALGRTTSYTYDALSRQVGATDPAGGVSTQEYDAVGHPVAFTDADGHTTTSEYDLAGRVIATVDPLGDTMRFGYDAAGRRTSMTDPSGNTTRYAYDPVGNLASVTEGAMPAPAPAGADVNVTTAYAYDPAGQLTRITDPLGAVTRFAYDPVGRLVSEVNPLGVTTSYRYDAAGQLVSSVDGNGAESRYAYTPAGLLAQSQDRDGVTTFEYDPAGNLTALTDALGASGFVYDDAGRLVSQTDSLGQVVQYDYDATGARTRLGLPTGDVTYGYDDAGRPATLTSPWGQLAYGWDAAGNLTDVLRSTGVTSHYGYDAANRVTSITHRSPGSELGCDLGANDIEIGATVDPLLDLCVTVDLDLPALTGLDYGDELSLAYTYDRAGNVTSQTRTDGSAAPVSTSYGYDRLSRLVSSVTGRDHDEFGYDKAGNRTRWVTTDHPDTGGKATTTAAYNGAGQLTERTVATPGLLGLFPKVTTTSYGYDRNGNRVSEKTGARTTSYSWTARNQVASVTDAGGKVSFGYDGLGRAVTQTSRSLLSSDRILSVFDGLVPVGEDSSVSGVRSLVRDVTGDVAIQNAVRPGVLGTGLLGGVDTRWGFRDRLGSTVGQGQGSRISQLVSYDVWGVATFATAGVDSTVGFSGEVQDPGSGLVGFHARSYEPVTGSWLSADPYRGELGLPQTLGRYLYVGDNPATSRDLLGYQVPRMTMGGTGGFTPKRAVAPPRHPASGGGSRPPSVYSPSNRLEALSARHSLDASSIALPLAGLGTRIAAGGAAAGAAAAAGSASTWWLLALRVFGGGFALGLILSTSGDSTHAAQEAEDRRQAQAAAKPAAVSTPATPPDDDCEIFCTQSNPLAKPVDRVEQAVDKLNDNDLHHIFNKPDHNLAPLVEEYGGQMQLMREVLKQAVPQVTGKAGNYEVLVSVSGQTVEVTGRVVDGIVRVGTMYVPK